MVEKVGNVGSVDKRSIDALTDRERDILRIALDMYRGSLSRVINSTSIPGVADVVRQSRNEVDALKVRIEVSH